MPQSAHQQGDAQTTLTPSQRLVRKKWRVAGYGMLVLVTCWGLAGLAAWAQLYWLAGVLFSAGLGLPHAIAWWNI